jgi:hypothetical protein
MDGEELVRDLEELHGLGLETTVMGSEGRHPMTFAVIAILPRERVGP